MTLEPISYKQVLDSEGALEALEIWQDGQCVTVSLAVTDLHRSGYRWNEVKEVVDRLAEKAKQDVQTLSLADDVFEQWQVKGAEVNGLAATGDGVTSGFSDPPKNTSPTKAED